MGEDFDLVTRWLETGRGENSVDSASDDRDYLYNQLEKITPGNAGNSRGATAPGTVIRDAATHLHEEGYTEWTVYRTILYLNAEIGEPVAPVRAAEIVGGVYSEKAGGRS